MKSKLWVRVVCWVLAGLMLTGVATYLLQLLVTLL